MADHIKIGDITPWEQTEQTVAGNKDFQFNFPIFRDEDLEVYVDDELLTLATDYTVAGAGDDDGGTITMTTAPAVGAVITRRRRIAIQRTSDFQDSGEFRAKVLNDELDYVIAVVQQVANDIVRSLVTAPTDPAGNLVLPALEDRKGRVLGFDAATGKPLAASAAGDALVSVAMEAVVQAASRAAALALLGGEPADAAILKADADAMLAAGFGQSYLAAVSLDGQAGDIYAVRAAGSNRKKLAVDVAGTIDATGMPAGSVLLECTVSGGSFTPTFAGSTAFADSGTWDSTIGTVNFVLFESNGTTVHRRVWQ